MYNVGWTGKNDYDFFWWLAEKEQTFKNLNNLNVNQATQNTDISTKIMKENSDIFKDFNFSIPNVCINTSLYPSVLKMADITLVHSKDSKS